ncbi:ATPase family AAA domain-containing protein 1 [Marchantia polymorpha subsp. ruderalis]|uniref:AAA+ ATPase domain-containing protein n=2 Tax=Marchantia polymorpha TaxID=3197 RepID=A0AAF6ALW4_MARPO|nr:hypothetical protein MARPO_0005s0041 [Marchantia polymorpha]BBM97434.1 hypothetical protein Mp_1g05660 [Marchantia polymorpha subsp. ruderalis]|eukprot:PTQ48369.1 hypothetical protein MARPO_0005s0041 [Marchantia polymorpha]
MGASSRAASVGQELVLYAVSAALSCLVLFVGLRHLDPNRSQAKKASERKKEISRRLGRPYIQTNTYEDMIACDVINPEDIDVTFNSIGGLELVKQSLHELVILPLQRPDLFQHGKLLRPQKGVLLFGPPGTGKTLLAKAIAKESQAVFINVRVATLMSKWFGDAQKLVTAVFTLAYKLQPSIIFIDEVDSFLGQRRVTEHEALTNMKTEFMALWDGFTTDQNARVMVLAATNRPWELDEAILRRLPRAFEVPMPDARQRASILRVILKGEHVEDDLDIEKLANQSEGYSGSDLTELCKQAAYLPIRDLLADESQQGYSSGEDFTAQRPLPRPLKQSDFESVLSVSRTSKTAAYDYQFSQRHANGGIGRSSGEDHVEFPVTDLFKLFATLSTANNRRNPPDP